MAWFADAYRKFETMCLEVEEDCQEGYRYMEDQVKTVGENFKQFCTEFVTEVLPESFLMDDPVSDPSPIQISDGVNQISVNTGKDRLESETCEERVSTEASSNEIVIAQVAKIDNDPLAYPASNSAVLEHRLLRIKPPSNGASTGLTKDMTVDLATLLRLNCKEHLDGSCILVDDFELVELSTEARPRSFKKKVGSVLLNKRRSSKSGSSEPDSGHSEGACEHVSSKSTTTFQCEEDSESDWEFV